MYLIAMEETTFETCTDSNVLDEAEEYCEDTIIADSNLILWTDTI
jgi:hypothetical protein